jgi:metal-dependent amidase/aminoacylase/carboxypeptidase family protein
MVTNNSLSALYIANAGALGRSVEAPSSHRRVVGSTDMGNISHLVPSIHPMIASARPGTSIHTKEFAHESISPLADQAVIDGAKAMAMTAIDFWTSSQAQSAIREEFAQANTDKDVL